MAGTLGAVVFVTVFTLEGWLRPGYDSRNMFVSELSFGPRGFVQILNFLFLGVSQLLFARGLTPEFPDGTASHTGPVVLGVIGIAFLAAGVFVGDPIGTTLASLSWHGLLHGLCFPLVFYGWPLACFILLRRFREDPRWRPLASCTFAAGALSAVLAVFLTLRFRLLWAQPELGHGATEWLGLIQRAQHIVCLSWQLVVAVWLWHLATAKHTPARECS